MKIIITLKKRGFYMFLLVTLTILIYTSIMVGILAKLHSTTAIRVIELINGRSKITFKQKKQQYEQILLTR